MTLAELRSLLWNSRDSFRCGIGRDLSLIEHGMPHKISTAHSRIYFYWICRGQAGTAVSNLHWFSTCFNRQQKQLRKKETTKTLPAPPFLFKAWDEDGWRSFSRRQEEFDWFCDLLSDAAEGPAAGRGDFEGLYKNTHTHTHIQSKTGPEKASLIWSYSKIGLWVWASEDINEFSHSGRSSGEKNLGSEMQVVVAGARWLTNHQVTSWPWEHPFLLCHCYQLLSLRFHFDNNFLTSNTFSLLHLETFSPVETKWSGSIFGWVAEWGSLWKTSRADKSNKPSVEGFFLLFPGKPPCHVVYAGIVDITLFITGEIELAQAGTSGGWKCA